MLPDLKTIQESIALHTSNHANLYSGWLTQLHCASLDTREVVSHCTQYESVNLIIAPKQMIQWDGCTPRRTSGKCMSLSVGVVAATWAIIIFIDLGYVT